MKIVNARLRRQEALFTLELQDGLIQRMTAQTAMQTAVRDELANSWRFAYSSLFNDYVSGLENGAKVESNIDLYFRD